MADVPVVVQELTGSHYTTVQMLESAVGAEHVKIEQRRPAANALGGAQERHLSRGHA